MNQGLRRRRFLQMASALGLGSELAHGPACERSRPLRAEETQVKPEMVKFRPEIEPVVRLIEETPRERALEVAIAQLKKGLSYKNLLAGLFLAGIRNIKPRPVGFKFHAVMVINSAHVLGQSSAVSERLLPLLWALDNFKASQAQDVKEGDWVLGPVDESRLPKPQRAQRGIRPGDGSVGRRRPPTRPSPRSAAARAPPRRWSRSGAWRCATSATSATRRSSPPRAGGPCRRSAGSTPSRCCGRSSSGCSTSRATPGRGRSGPYEANLENAAKIRQDWHDRPRRPRRHPGTCSRSIRQATPEAASAEAVKLLNQGVSPGSLWDAAILAACELMMHSPDIVAHPRHHGRPTPCTTSSRPAATTRPGGWPCSRPSAGSRCFGAAPN